MKKVLSVILAIVMIAMCMPIAFAVEITGIEAELFDSVCRYYGSYYSVYTKDGKTGELGMHIPGGPGSIYEGKGFADPVMEIFDYGGIKKLVAEDSEKAVEYLGIMNDIHSEVDSWLAESGYEMVIDAYGMWIIESFHLYYDEETFYAIGDFLEVECDVQEYERLINVFDKEHDEVLRSALEDVNSVTQADFDATVNGYNEFVFKIIDCFEGNHTFTEYTDLGDGTHRADCTFCKSGEVVEAHTFGEHIPDDNGTTATAKCDKCDATDIIEVEWEDLPAEDDSNFFTMLIATIRDFFESIINFFKNLF